MSRKYLQLVGLTGPDESFESNYFPQAFGQFTTIKVWINEQDKGDRLVYATFTPYSGTWQVPKESGIASMIFLFADPVTNFVLEEHVFLSKLTVEEVLYYVEHYRTSIAQKKRLTEYLSRPICKDIILAKDLRVVWLNEEEIDEDHFVAPFGELTSTVLKPLPEIVDQHIKVKKRNPPGRPPLKEKPIDKMEIGSAIVIKPEIIPERITSAASAVNLQSKMDKDLRDRIMQRVLDDGKDSALQILLDLKAKRQQHAQSLYDIAYRNWTKLNETPLVDRPHVNLSAPCTAENNHFASLEWLTQEAKEAWDYLQAVPNMFNDLIAEVRSMNG